MPAHHSEPAVAATPEIALIAALDENDLIGANGAMPWHLRADLQHFKRKTLHKPILMGRRTHTAIGRALPQRRNLVLTRNSRFAATGCERVASLAEARALAAAAHADQLMVIGGAQVYALALPHAQRLYLTRIHGRFTGDTWFPQIDWSQWRQVASETHAAPDEATPAFTFTEWLFCAEAA
ncbi:MAG TPA: dihydrofolate reductase [Salinisphaeraceae bacterium]|nr:dihydrofolate reductase [Salinisphaeraceae bacterium]